MFSSGTQFKRILTDGRTDVTSPVVRVCCVIACLKLDSVGSCQMKLHILETPLAVMSILGKTCLERVGSYR